MPVRDGIAEPWGSRTPYGPGESWPTRVDSHLADGVAADQVERWVQSAAVLHSNGDALDIAVRDGRIVGVRGRDVDRVNHGRLDPKDLFGWQANASPERLTRPLVREGDRLVESDWDIAMDRIVRRSKELLDEQGPSALGFYTSGQLFCEEYYTLAAIGHGAIGTNHLDGNTRLCTATAAAALKESFGCDGQPGSYTDIDHADVIALYGHNMAETQAVLWMRILDRLAGPNPPAVICVDPRQTPVAEAAMLHLAPVPGTNVAMMNGILHEIIATSRVDHDYVHEHTVGYDELATTVKDYPAERVAEICRLPAEQVREAARIIGGAERLLSTVLQGFLPGAPSHCGGRAGQQRAPGTRHDRQAGRGCPADERPADRGEHPRVRRRRRPHRLPQLGQRRACRRAGADLESRRAAGAALRPAHPPDADDALRGGGHHPAAVDQRHQPGRVVARAATHPVHPGPGAAVPRSAGDLPHRDRRVGRCGAAGCGVG